LSSIALNNKNQSSSASSSTSSLHSVLMPIKLSSVDLYSYTIFNYLKEYNQLEYLALEDFTLKVIRIISVFFKIFFLTFTL
jgi:hypothetical protein